MDTLRNLPAPEMPLYTHWNSHDLADAVPLRLSELLDFDVGYDIERDPVSANASAFRPARPPMTFLCHGAHALFRIR